MEEKKEKKKLNKKPLVICLAIALILAVIGFVDIKSNAAELDNCTVNFVYTVHHFKDSSGSQYLGGYPSTKTLETVYSDSPVSVYYYCNAESMSNSSYDLYAYYVSKSEIALNGYGAKGIFVSNGITYYWVQGAISGSTFANYPGYIGVEIEGADKVYKLSLGDYYPTSSGRDLFVQHISNSTLNCEQLIDYDNLEIDESIDVVNNLKVNKLNDSKFYKNQVIYDYLTWSNTENMKLQVQFQPVVKIYKNSKHETYLREYSGEWFDSELLDVGAQSFLCGMDVIGTTIDKDSLVNVDSWEFFSNIYGNADYYDWSGFNAESPEFCYRYRVRYIDTDNLMASRWVYVSPSKQYEQYEAYIEEIDDSQNIVNGSLGGSKIDIDDIGIDAGIESIENENAFKDKYEIIDGNADTQEVMNWLNTVVSFIKGTPDLVTEVLSFLPQPILYGMYITIFLGVIASAIAIIKALI